MDNVLLVCENGRYPTNEKGQMEYPRPDAGALSVVSGRATLQPEKTERMGAEIRHRLAPIHPVRVKVNE